MTREDLKDYKNNQEWLKEQMDFIEESESKLNKLSSILSGMPGTTKGFHDSMAENIAKMQDNIKETMDYATELQIKELKIIKQLRQMGQPYRKVLYNLYIKGKEIVDVASEMHYSYKYTVKLHGIALNKFDALSKEVTSEG